MAVQQLVTAKEGWRYRRFRASAAASNARMAAGRVGRGLGWARIQASIAAS